MLDILLLHKPEDNRDARCWVLAKGKDLRSEVNFLYSSLLEKMTKDELTRRLNKYTGINLEINLDGSTPREWLKNNIRKSRIKKDFTKKEIARLTGTSGRDWTRFEEGKRLPNCKKLRKIVDILRIKTEIVCENDDFCLHSLDAVINSLKEREWIPLIVVHGLLKIYKENFGIKRKDLNRIKTQIISSIEHLKVNQYNSVPIKAVKKVNKDLAKIIGAFAADGNYFPPDMIRWEEEYKDNLEALSKWFQNSFSLELSVKPEERGRNSFVTKFRNKIVGRYFEVFFGLHPKTKKYTVSEPELIKQQSFKIRKAFASGALMFDGGVNCDATISLTLASKKLRDSIVEILRNDGIKIYSSKKPNVNSHWCCYTSLKFDRKELIKLSCYFEKGTTKRKRLEAYIYGFKNVRSDIETFIRKMFPKIRNKIHPADLIKISRKLHRFDIYDLIKITKIPRPTLIRYLRILEVAGVLTSMRKRRKIYMVNKFSTKPLGSYLVRSS